MRIRNLTFTNRKGLELSAKLELPAEGRASEFVLFAHCFTCGKDIAAIRNISRALASEGFGVLRFDFTGLGSSEGEFADSHFSANVEDLVDASEFLAQEYKAPSVLIGHSLGGAAVVFAASLLDTVKAVATIGAPADPEHVTHLFGSALESLEKDGEAELKLVGRTFKVRKDFVKHLQDRDMDGVLKALRKPILICHSPQDTIVGINNAAQIYMAAHHPKSFLSLDGADHLLTEARDSLYVGRMIAAWVDRYVERKEVELRTDEQVVVSLTEPGFTAKVLAGDHRLLADEPASVGGLDLGPSPYDFLSIGLAACTAMTIRMYTDRKQWPIDEVNVHVSYGKHSHGEDSEHTGEAGAMLDTFFRKIEIIGEVDEAQRKRILQIADKCPVHKTLEASSVIKTEELTAT
jgi:uncharacterized OsmC-like protein/fermentation-respiration switch protein FrsA (DUF1100 family)